MVASIIPLLQVSFKTASNLFKLIVINPKMICIQYPLQIKANNQCDLPLTIPTERESKLLCTEEESWDST